MYDYRKAVKEDVLEYIKNEINFSDFETLEELEEKLNDDLWTVDSVTGNATVLHNAEFIQQMEFSDGFYICFREKSAMELAMENFQSQIDYIAMMADVDM